MTQPPMTALVVLLRDPLRTTDDPALRQRAADELERLQDLAYKLDEAGQIVMNKRMALRAAMEKIVDTWEYVDALDIAKDALTADRA